MKFIGSNLSTSWCKLSLGLVWYSCSLSMAEYNQWQKESLSDLEALNIDTHHSWLSRVNLSVCIPKKYTLRCWCCKTCFKVGPLKQGKEGLLPLTWSVLRTACTTRKGKPIWTPPMAIKTRGNSAAWRSDIPSAPTKDAGHNPVSNAALESTQSLPKCKVRSTDLTCSAKFFWRCAIPAKISGVYSSFPLPASDK
jgi:hypothetical protein